MRVSGNTVRFIFAFWAGFVSSISFLEAWLKFRAEGVTREIGVGIGKLVFTVVNRVEVVLLLGVWIILFMQKSYNVFRVQTVNVMLWVITLILVLQTSWLIPVLTARAEMIIAGTEPGESPVHLLFGIVELSKVVLLILLAFRFKRQI